MFTPIEFLVDTGASASCLHPRDALDRVGFTSDELVALARAAPASRSFVGVTGSAVYAGVPAQYLLVHDDGQLQAIDADIHIAQPVAINLTIPSILGWDILQHFRIVLDRRTGEVLLQ